MEAILPLWVEGRLVWITGLTKRTTCSDVIASVINFHRGKCDEIHEKWQYKVIERWRWMERHLPGRCKILKIWQSWCEERKNVYFLLKKRSPKNENSSKEKKYTKIKVPRSRHGYKSHHRFKMKNDHYIFDREELKSILSMQQNALQIQKEKLALRESEIEEYETLTHLSRIKQSGENYLQVLYLGNEGHLSLYPQKKADHLPNLSDDAVREATILYERILEISKRIEKQEQNIRLLSAQIRHSVSANDSFEDSNNSFAKQSNNDNFVIYLQKTKIRTECLAAVNETQRLAIEHNERTLDEYNKILAQKKNYLSLLQKDLYRADDELNNIQQGNFAYNGNVEEWQSAFDISRDDVVLIDNSSDTGLSSLPSSCEDNGYIMTDKNSNFLDTLV
ncbi:uncharacterized protein TNCT_200181 [Trichonephila clavata]|uniref:Ras association domain-containing protein 10 n=1 Tax=Trichonephila clavata TaxID=2740835 RepID=A0A8X6FYB9_TRICU|nr:uncharacterized protein TNCT_200181 [Trichonephila clavata]